MMTEVANEAIALCRRRADDDRQQLLFQRRLVVRAVHRRPTSSRSGSSSRGSAPTTAAAERRAGSLEDDSAEVETAAEARGLRYALFGFLGVLALVLADHASAWRAAARPGHRRHHRHHAVHGQPAVHHRHVLPGLGHRLRRSAPGRSRARNDVIAAITKTFNGLAGLVFMLLMIAQFIAYFNYTNMPERIGGGAGRVARDGAVSPPCRCSSGSSS